MHSQPGVTSPILLAAVLCCLVSIFPACCTSVSGDKSDVVSFSFPSFKGVDKGDSRFDLSWDAGFIDGALHLTVDDANQPLVSYPLDPRRPLGRIILRPSFLLSVASSRNWLPSSQDASFNTTFTMRVNRSPRNQQAATKSIRLSRNQQEDTKSDGGGLLFEVLPDVSSYRSSSGYYSYDSYNSLASLTSGNISVDMGTLNGYTGLYVLIKPATPANYSVWIDYDGKGQIIWVYVDRDNKPKPARATLGALNISGIIRWPDYGSNFGLVTLSSYQPVIYSWNLTVEKLHKPSSHMPRWFLAIMICFVLIATIAAIVLFFRKSIASALASRYRALRMKLKLSRELRRLPGIPREFKYADVKNATKNFHESMRLGKGGFGAVYKGTIEISTAGVGEDGQRRRRLADVAVKKFTRKENSGYEDFLAEVAVINRLRHKNIVPLTGNEKHSSILEAADSYVSITFCKSRCT